MVEERYCHVSKLAIELVSFHRATRIISKQKSDHVIFQIKILQNPHSYHVLQTWNDLAFSDFPKLILCSSPLILTSAPSDWS